MWISPAYAQSAGGAGEGIVAFLPLILIFVVFYFLLIRPQQKKMKARNQMLSEVRRGDKVMTGGGIFGTVTKVTDDNQLIVEIAEGVKVTVARATIGEVLSRSGAADAKGGEGKAKGGDDRGKGPTVEKPKGLLGGLGGLMGGRK